MKRLALLIGAALLAAGCQFKMKPSFPAARIAEELRLMTERDYKLTMETRHLNNNLQAFFWTVGMMTAAQDDMSPKASDALQGALMCATRVALSTDAPLQFIEVKMADVLTGASVTVWRYVPDILAVVQTRIGEEEYMNRLVLEINPETPTTISADGKKSSFDPPITMEQFLAKQIVLRAKRKNPQLQAHEDLSTPKTLTFVIDNWSLMEQTDAKSKENIETILQTQTKQVLRGYRFNGFQGVVLRDSQGASLGRWAL